MRIFQIAFIITLLLVSGEADACDFKKIDFGSSFKQAQEKYKFLDDYRKDVVTEVNLRTLNICEKTSNGRATLTFFNDRLAKVYIENISDNTEFYELIKTQFGELNVAPNFSEIKNNKFAGFVSSDKKIVTYTYQKTDSNIFEAVNISDKSFLEGLSEYETRNEKRGQNK